VILYNKSGDFMEDKIEFKSLNELYRRVKPALYSKLKEVRRLGLKYVTETDIWNYLVENVWKSKENLQLHELINDILYANNYDLNEYAMRKVKTYKEKEDLIMEDESLI
jgi:uncharacterized protein YktA (UPF0223 family)